MSPTPCESVRVLAALRPDGALSELEERRLQAHVAGCSSCDAFLTRIETVTSGIRATPHEQPDLVPILARGAPPAARSGKLRESVLKLGAATAVVMLATVVGRLTVETPSAPVGPPVGVVDASFDEPDAEKVRALLDAADGRDVSGGDPPRPAAPRPFLG